MGDVSVGKSRLDELNDLAVQVVADASKDADTQSFRYMISANGRTEQIYGSYCNGEAAIKHDQTTFAPFADCLMALGLVTVFTVYGTLSSKAC